MLAPIIVTVYDRLGHLQQCIGALQKNDQARDSELYVVSDAAYKPEHRDRIEKVREYVRTISGFKEVKFIFREVNYGAFRSFLDGVNQVLASHERFIFLEDDVLACPQFLRYLNDGLQFYEKENKVFSIAAYTHPIQLPHDFKGDVFFLPANCPWGFASWKNRFEKVDFSAMNRYAIVMNDKALYRRVASMGNYMLGILKSDSEEKYKVPDVRVAFHQFVHEQYTVHARTSLVRNIGLDGSGLHSGVDKENKYHVTLDDSMKTVTFSSAIELNPRIMARIRRFQNGNLRTQLVFHLSQGLKKFRITRHLLDTVRRRSATR